MGWVRGASFSLVSLTSFHIVNTVILSSSSLLLSLSDSPSLPPSFFLVFFLSLFHTHTCYQTQTLVQRSGKFLTNIYPAAMSRPSVEWLLKWGKSCKLIMSQICHCCLPGLSIPAACALKPKRRCLFHFFSCYPGLCGTKSVKKETWN